MKVVLLSVVAFVVLVLAFLLGGFLYVSAAAKWYAKEAEDDMPRHPPPTP
ncbi:MAG: hypothetical protein AAB604_01570 [Patescibacteria group bacterium]